MASMTTEEVSDIFRVHQYFLNTTQRLSLSPNVVNVDRLRDDMSPTGKIITRSTREWVMTLKTANGGPLQCDVENGGIDRKAYMIVATTHLEQAKKELEKYKASLRRFHAPNSTNALNETGTTFRPTEIYIPTKAVLKNIAFMQQMSAADVWKAAPQAVRQSTLSQTTVSNKTAPRPRRSTNNPKPGFDIDEQDTSTEGGTNSVSSSRHTRNQRQPSMDITVETSHSPLTKATNGNTTRASNTSDLDASVARQQAEFQKLSEKSNLSTKA